MSKPDSYAGNVRSTMPIEDPVAAQFAAWNAHDHAGFVRCNADNFCAYRMPSLTPTLEGKSALREFLRQPAL